MDVKEMKTWLDSVEDRIKGFGEQLGGVEEIKGRLDDMEQKAARKGGYGGPAAPASWGKQVADRAAEAKSYFDSRASKGTFSMEMKATITSDPASAGDLLPATNMDPFLAMARRPLRVRDLLPAVKATGNSVEYPKMLTSTNNAATVAEGALKPESAMTFDLVTTPIRTLAHWVPASRQILEDVPQLMGIVDGELRFGLDYVEDNQLLNGAGTGTDLSGLNTNATAFTAGTLVIASPTLIDVIGAAILQQALANLPADGIILHPADWTRILTLKDSAGGYIVGDPIMGNAGAWNGAQVPPMLFGVPVAQTVAETAGNFLVGAFQASTTLYDRWETRVEISTEHSDFFTRNLVAILAEKRIGLAVKRSTGLTKGTFTTAITDLTS
jgi:HK97 family phage major capsid protein